MRGDSETELLEEVVFELAGAFIGGKDAGLHFFKFWGDEALAVGDGLFADVVRRDEVQVRFGDFDVVTEDFVVADFEGFDAGAIGFSDLELSDPVFAGGGEGAEFVEFGVKAGFDNAAVLELEWGVINEGALESVEEFWRSNEAGGDGAEEGGSGFGVVEFGSGEGG